MTDQCHWCDLPESAHPVYRQVDGEHDYEPRVEEPPIARPDRPRERPCTCATSDTPAQHHCGPSAQLPPRCEDTERARDWPAYQTGRAPAQPETRPMLPEHMQGREAMVSADVHHSIDFTKQSRPGLLRRIWDAARKAST